MSFFSGAGSTHFEGTVSGTTAPTRFSEPQGTDERSTVAIVSPPPGPAGVNQWLTSPAAQPYAGRWVLLSDDFQVLDSANSPSDLLDRHPDVATPTVVLVDPAGAVFAV